MENENSTCENCNCIKNLNINCCKEINSLVEVISESNNDVKSEMIFNKNKGLKQYENNKLLQIATSKLPSNYNFEINKTLLKIQTLHEELIDNCEKSKDEPIIVAIQLPDGLAHFSVIISDIFIFI